MLKVLYISRRGMFPFLAMSSKMGGTGKAAVSMRAVRPSVIIRGTFS